MSGNISVQINPHDMAEVKKLLKQLSGDESLKAMARGLNKTFSGVVTDGTSILREHYALKASDIRSSFKVNKCSFRDPHGSVSSKGTFLRLRLFGARQTNAGVSVKVLQNNPRKTIKHAFIAKLRSDQKEEQVYIRKWHDEKRENNNLHTGAGAMARKGYVWSKRQKRWIPAKWMDKYKSTGEFKFRLPIKALYGPRIQTYLGDKNIMKVLLDMTGERLTRNMRHEVEYLLDQAK